ncbi:hypothetical protein E4N62_02425 [Streptomyces sp. MNU76]|uniref:hypothetical protein n=1 Tax=Streptomyces sp. MNU76 TaxID=2560026 RepID=UPI001E634066|nr:hypothetical protein [Streptomyces sp. MNU76]MCC9704218.1 hypothetical protein [Streptomyces sp. MNU76]
MDGAGGAADEWVAVWLVVYSPLMWVVMELARWRDPSWYVTGPSWVYLLGLGVPAVGGAAGDPARA